MWTISKLFIFGQEACGISAPRPTPPARQGEEGLIAGEVPKEPIFLEVPKGSPGKSLREPIFLEDLVFYILSISQCKPSLQIFFKFCEYR